MVGWSRKGAASPVREGFRRCWAGGSLRFAVLWFQGPPEVDDRGPARPEETPGQRCPSRPARVPGCVCVSEVSGFRLGHSDL